MANCANRRTGSAKELSPVTGNAGFMVGVISNVGKITEPFPVLCRHLMTGDTVAAVFFGRVRKPGVVDSRPGSSCRPPPLASLCRSRIEEIRRKQGSETY